MCVLGLFWVCSLWLVRHTQQRGWVVGVVVCARWMQKQIPTNVTICLGYLCVLGMGHFAFAWGPARLLLAFLNTAVETREPLASERGQTLSWFGPSSYAVSSVVGKREVCFVNTTSILETWAEKKCTTMVWGCHRF